MKKKSLIIFASIILLSACSQSGNSSISNSISTSINNSVSPTVSESTSTSETNSSSISSTIENEEITLVERIKEIQNSNHNYTIVSSSENVSMKCINNAIYQNAPNTQADTYGFMENETGIFKFGYDDNQEIIAKSKYFKDDSGNNLHSLYEVSSIEGSINQTEVVKLAPSFDQLDLTKLASYTPSKGQYVVNYDDFSFLAIGGWEQTFRNEKTTVKVEIKENSTLFTFSCAWASTAFEVTNVNTTTIEGVEDYLANNKGALSDEGTDKPSEGEETTLEQIKKVFSEGEYSYLSEDEAYTYGFTSNFTIKQASDGSSASGYIYIPDDNKMGADGGIYDYEITSEGVLPGTAWSRYTSIQDIDGAIKSSLIDLFTVEITEGLEDGMFAYTIGDNIQIPSTYLSCFNETYVSSDDYSIAGPMLLYAPSMELIQLSCSILDYNGTMVKDYISRTINIGGVSTSELGSLVVEFLTNF